MPEQCFKCQQLIEEGKTEEEAQKDHENCHNWIHCDPECCDGCPFCGR